MRVRVLLRQRHILHCGIMLIATTLILAHLAWGYRDAVVRRQEADVTAVSDCHLHGTEVLV